MLVGGATTSAMCEYGMQLSWAGDNAAAQPALQRVVDVAEALLQRKQGREQNGTLARGVPPPHGNGPWGDKGSLDMCGYMPLSLVMRMNGDAPGALALADRCVRVVGELGMGVSAEGRKTTARCLGAQAMALYGIDRAAAWPTMARALEVGRDAHGRVVDGALLNIASQLHAALPPQATQTTLPAHAAHTTHPNQPVKLPQPSAAMLHSAVAHDAGGTRLLPHTTVAASAAGHVAAGVSRGAQMSWANRLEQRSRRGAVGERQEL